VVQPSRLQVFVVRPSRLQVFVVRPSRLQVFVVRPSRLHMQAGRLHHKFDNEPCPRIAVVD